MKYLDLKYDIADTILVTHKNCCDGAGCALMFLAAGGKKENIVYISAGRLESFVKKEINLYQGKKIIFADIGMNDPACADKLEKRGDIVLIDHHSTSKFLSSREWVFFSEESCGTELLRQFLTVTCNMKLSSSGFRLFSILIDDHDRWILKHTPLSLELVMMMSFIGQEAFVDKFDGSIEETLKRGTGLFWNSSDLALIKTLHRKREECANDAIRSAIIRNIEFDNNILKMAVIPYDIEEISYVLDKVLDALDVDIAAMLSLRKNVVSLRSRNGTDVSKFAKLFGGGGHKCASGHPIPYGTANEFIDLVYGLNAEE